MAPAADADTAPRLEKLTIVAPASAGGGWDQTARAMDRALRASGAAATVEVVNSPGAGGAIGLAQFVSAYKGNGNALLVGGSVMLGAIRAHQATVSLLDTTPIARLAGDYHAIVVPASSERRTLDELLAAFCANPGGITWAGGSHGGTDQLLLSLLARAVGIDPHHVNYVPFPGGGDAARALVAGDVSAGVSGYAELAPDVEAGRLRLLAISSPERIPGLAAPTLRERGIDLVLVNWRGVFAPPALTDAQRARLLKAVRGMAKSAEWQAMLRQHRWVDLYQSGPEFTRFVEGEQAREPLGGTPAVTREAQARWSLLALRYTWRAATGAQRALILSGAALAMVFLGLLCWRTLRDRRRERVLLCDLETARQTARLSTQETESLLSGLAVQIDRQFKEWALTAAEREVAMLMLKGLRHKDIASVRGTSERTVRQQALTIYKKAHLDGRTDLAAFFLEDLLAPAVEGAGGRRRSA
jgi:putative tricarboxylic transport membrane protein